ncbi:hypothetical protein [Acidithiobacillus caldus]|uniref:hypothetical protein n=1 Tax=Acidithiobacillus caldus TaxID=33059 RepID=UPI00056F6201|nr:hypothetical protein [Acidithiobacillus caldus]MBU2730036.1 hypothetical protein [Acidithiobacillus caldus]MBU2735728.1 hypothetical protein [Acidithiobacillus caldus ATCC 51756]MBU2743804.1 hypothetical protein [Acidithiobacillus caldus]MBU2780929.1 hypothetical protein [Acidithiobacillus caldus]
MSAGILSATMLLAIFWMGQFIWFPDGDALVRLLLADGSPPQSAEERWAMDLYRATFSPDAVPRWIQRALVRTATWEWFLLLVLAVVLSLSDVGLCPSILAGLVFPAWGMLQLLLSFLFLAETILLWRAKTPIGSTTRKLAWLAAHPLRPLRGAPLRLPSAGLPPARPPAGRNPPAGRSPPPARLPWWFWIDRGSAETVLRMLVFLGGFLASVAVVLYVSYASGSRLSVEGFWQILVVWGLVVLESIVPITLWLYYLDWTHRDRSVLLSWARRQGRNVSPRRQESGALSRHPPENHRR